MTGPVLLQEAAFLAVAIAYVYWAQCRLIVPCAKFPGPRPVGPVFKAWLVVIWVVGLLLPLLALVVDGHLGGHSPTLLALWPINIGVHYTNIPNALRRDYHGPDARFPSLHYPLVFTMDAQDRDANGAEARTAPASRTS